VSNRRAKLVRFEDGLDAVTALPDRQSQAFLDHEVADAAFVEAFEAHFAGTGVLEDRARVQAATRLRNSIRRGVERQLDAIIEMGRALLEAERVFTRKEWMHLLEGGQKLLGLPKHTASMYRAIARDIDDQRIPRELCPDSFSTVYVFTTYKDWQLQAAKKAGLLRPTVTRKEVEEFKRIPADRVLLNAAAAEQQLPSQPAANLGALRDQERYYAKKERLLLNDLAKVQGHLEAIRDAIRAATRSET